MLYDEKAVNICNARQKINNCVDNIGEAAKGIMCSTVSCMAIYYPHISYYMNSFANKLNMNDATLLNVIANNSNDAMWLLLTASLFPATLLFDLACCSVLVSEVKAKREYISQYIDIISNKEPKAKVR